MAAVQTFYQPADAILVDVAVHAEIIALPTYGYRRACAIINRTRALMGLQAINHKRFYWASKENCLLLSNAPKSHVSRSVHDRVVHVNESNQRWCSDDFEISCENGEIINGVLMENCFDREIIAWRACAERDLLGLNRGILFRTRKRTQSGWFHSQPEGPYFNASADQNTRAECTLAVS